MPVNEVLQKYLAEEEARKQRQREAHARYRKTDKGKALVKSQREKHKEKRVARQKEYYAKNPDRYRNHHFVKTYGITLEERDAKLEAQGGKCAICETVTPGGKGWHVDHCHTTGKLRDVLCNRCNLGLGYFNDDVATMEKAIAYIQRHIDTDLQP